MKGNILICTFKRLHLAEELNRRGVRNQVHLGDGLNFTTRERKHSQGDRRCASSCKSPGGGSVVLC